jgi:hypothetical protein
VTGARDGEQLDGRERGFIVLHRRVRSSPLYQGLTPEQRSVFVAILLLANWCDKRRLLGGRWETIRRGELVQSLETIAEEAGLRDCPVLRRRKGKERSRPRVGGVKVVRSTIEKLMLDDRPGGGNGPFLSERWTGGTPGGGFRVLRVERYDQYQRVNEQSGTEPDAQTDAQTGTLSGIGRAADGRATGAPEAPLEPREPREPPSLLRSEGAPPPTARAASGVGKPDFALAVEHWYAAWERAGRGKHARLTGAEGKQLKDLLAELGLDELRARMDRALRDPWFLEHGDLLAFVKQRNKFARRGAPTVVDERTKRIRAAIERAQGTCPEWGAMLQAAARGAGNGGMHLDTVESVLLDVQAERHGQVLELRGRDEFHANLLADRFHDWLLAGARAVSGEALHVQITGPRAGGQA